MKKFKLTIKLSETKILHFTVSGYSNKEGRIRFQDEITGNLKNFPEEWVGIEEVVE